MKLSVQNVENEIEFLQNDLQGIIRPAAPAYLFREDFCGTASGMPVEWVKPGADEYQAIGVDIDPTVLDWGRKNRVGQLAARRIGPASA